MAQLKKYNLEGKELGSCEVDKRFVECQVNSQLIKDYITALRANSRQWSANTKGRSEVNHSTKKPHAQKGGGRARQGSLAAPQYKGGGRVFGPKPKFNQHVRINQKERHAAMRSIIAEKIRDNRMIVLDSTEMQEPKTSTVSRFLTAQAMQRRALFLAEGAYIDATVCEVPHRFTVANDTHRNFTKSVRNIPRATFKQVKNVSGYDLLHANHIIITENGLKELHEWLLPTHKDA